MQKTAKGQLLRNGEPVDPRNSEIGWQPEAAIGRIPRSQGLPKQISVDEDDDSADNPDEDWALEADKSACSIENKDDCEACQ
jgi:hypothetical protein